MRWAMVRVVLFLLAFLAFVIAQRTVGWTVPIKIAAAVLTCGGVTFLI
ncbi:MAG TPA: hypothetical protein VE397_19500 [Stellaceae bacterium]|jgi:hypothetical protein|nr:hypothetical protein [Stellaceae bacterium]